MRAACLRASCGCGGLRASCRTLMPCPANALPGRPPLAARSGAEELERDICFILGLLAIKVEHQQAICDAGALPTLVAMIKRYAARDDVMLSGVSAHTCRRAADAVTNLAHENNTIKNKVRQEAGIPPLVALLRSVDAKVQRGVAGTLRTLAFKNDENKGIIVELGSLPLLINMLRAEDATIHYEAVGVVGNLVHSSPAIKRRVLEEGALQPVINLLSSPCPDSQREAALLLGQFATSEPAGRAGAGWCGSQLRAGRPPVGPPNAAAGMAAL